MPDFTIHYVDQIDSTNSQLLQWSAQQACHRVVLVAEEQTAGRGQRGRNWMAEPGAALLCSVAWQFDRKVPLDGLSLAVGVWVAAALDASLGDSDRQRLRLKWPNDLLIDETHKLGGILIETVSSAVNTRTAVIGLGLNLRCPPPAAASGGLPAMGLDDVTGAVNQRDELLRGILRHLDDGLAGFASTGFAGVQAAWWDRCAFQMRRVSVRRPDGELFDASIRSVTERGALVIESERGLHTLISGEVSLRVAGS